MRLQGRAAHEINLFVHTPGKKLSTSHRYWLLLLRQNTLKVITHFCGVKIIQKRGLCVCPAIKFQAINLCKDRLARRPPLESLIKPLNP
jgi:hypothetical protein